MAYVVLDKLKLITPLLALYHLTPNDWAVMWVKLADGWVAVLTGEVGGRSTAAKQSAIHATCRRAGLRIETRTTATQVFIRNMNRKEVSNANG